MNIINKNRIAFEEYIKSCNSKLIKQNTNNKPNIDQFIDPKAISSFTLDIPIEYMWAHDAWLKQIKMIWVHTEISMHEDIRDWKEKLNDKERSILKTVMRFFAQSDVEVSKSYTGLYLQVFQPYIIQSMLVVFAAIETLHVMAYDYLMKSILSVSELKEENDEFIKHKEMIDKYEYLNSLSADTMADLIKALVTYGAFAEGVFLYASFAIFLYFREVKKVLNGTGQIVSWSMKDESLHVESLAKLFKTLLAENPGIMDAELTDSIYESCRRMVELEDGFIDLAMRHGDLEDMKKDDLKQYIRYLADHRLKQFGFASLYNVTVNPLPWMGVHIGSMEATNFFESTVVDYVKNSTEGDWDFLL